MPPALEVADEIYRKGATRINREPAAQKILTAQQTTYAKNKITAHASSRARCADISFN
jgi:hypothetical protein